MYYIPHSALVVWQRDANVWMQRSKTKIGLISHLMRFIKLSKSITPYIWINQTWWFCNLSLYRHFVKVYSLLLVPIEVVNCFDNGSLTITNYRASQNHFGSDLYWCAFMWRVLINWFQQSNVFTQWLHEVSTKLQQAIHVTWRTFCRWISPHAMQKYGQKKTLQISLVNIVQSVFFNPKGPISHASVVNDLY